MPTEPKADRPERSLTDESLRTERDKTDQALVDNQAAVEHDADEVVQKARDTADAVVVVAREKADEDIARDDVDTAAALLAGERDLADGLLAEERAAEDERLRVERNEQAKLLKRLLPLEREKTDRHLLTERIRSDDALASRDDFLSMVCHDLRNLLSGVAVDAFLIAEAVDERGTDDARPIVRSGAVRIQRYAARMNRLIGDLVDVGSIDAGRLAVEPVPGDFSAVVTETMDSFRGAARAKSITLTLEQLDEHLPATFDHDRMLQVLGNLFANAIKFTPEAGAILVRCEAAGGAIVFAIRDNGGGIPATMLESVFERFWQVGKNDRRGLGLGLYISRSIVEAHGGTIWAESVPGEGSRFCVRLPMAEPA